MSHTHHNMYNNNIELGHLLEIVPFWNLFRLLIAFSPHIIFVTHLLLDHVLLDRFQYVSAFKVMEMTSHSWVNSVNEWKTYSAYVLRFLGMGTGHKQVYIAIKYRSFDIFHFSYSSITILICVICSSYSLSSFHLDSFHIWMNNGQYFFIYNLIAINSIVFQFADGLVLHIMKLFAFYSGQLYSALFVSLGGEKSFSEMFII